MTLDDLFVALPFDSAMPELCPSGVRSPELSQMVQQLGRDLSPALQAGIYLYIDDLDTSHQISQSLESQTGSTWHGMMHRREGDYSNALYWLRLAGPHPAFLAANYDPKELVRHAQKAHGANPPDLVEAQRAEWRLLFDWCRENEQ